MGAEGRLRGRGWLRSAVLLLLLAWGLTSFSLELLRAFRLPAPPTAPPSRWTLRSPAVGEIGSFADRIDPILEPGRRIVLSTPRPWAEDFFLSLWHAYHLPRHDVVRGVHRWAHSGATHLIATPTPVSTLPGDRVPRLPATPLASHSSPTYSAHLYRLAGAGRAEATESRIP